MATRRRRSAREQPNDQTQRGLPLGAAAQPRPALGRRPWLALERRARSLRRFFLAIAGTRVPPGRRHTSSYRIVDTVSGWTSPPVFIARTPRDRWRGARRHDCRCAVLLRCSSVLGLGLEAPLHVAGIDASGRVRLVRRLAPQSRIRLRDCRWALEVPPSCPPPPLGAALAWRRSDVEAGPGAGPS